MKSKAPYVIKQVIAIALLHGVCSSAHAQTESSASPVLTQPEALIFVHRLEPIELHRDSVQVEFEILLDLESGQPKLVPCNEWYPGSVRGMRFIPDRLKLASSSDSTADRNSDRFQVLMNENIRDEMPPDNAYPGVYMSGSGWLIGVITQDFSQETGFFLRVDHYEDVRYATVDDCLNEE